MLPQYIIFSIDSVDYIGIKVVQRNALLQGDLNTAGGHMPEYLIEGIRCVCRDIE